MKYTKESIEDALQEITGVHHKFSHRISHLLFTAALAAAVFLLVSVSSLGLGLFIGILDSTPDIHSLQFGPTAYATKAYDRDGNLIATLVKSGSNREKVSYEELPENLVNAFVSIEDERFWQHNGIDFKSILRAVRGVLTDDSASGGGSTITQQLIKNSVFEGGLNEKPFERYIRKFQEQYLALQLENHPEMDKRKVKESIITDYLNTINLGANTLGVKVAAKRYFNKDVSALSLSECAVIASITKNPSALNPITHPKQNAGRRKQVLKNMLEQKYITQAEYDTALADPVYDRIKNVDIQTKEDQSPYSYFTDELISQVITALQDKLGYTRSKAENMLYSGGLSIYTTQDPNLQAIVDSEINNPDNYDTAKYSIEWRLSVKLADGSVLHYSEKDLLRYMKDVLGMTDFDGLFKTEDAAKHYIEQYKKVILSEGDEIQGENYNTSLEPQASFVLMDQHSGEVLAINGGRGEKKYSLTFNRATDAYRQPGSTFKVISAFAPAIDLYGATLATTYYDSPYTIGSKTFKNWYGADNYLGYQSIRDGIIYSLNIVAIRCMMETLSPEKGVAYAKRLGISSVDERDYNPSTALGGLYKGVNNLELTDAFATIAAGGIYHQAKFFTKIVDVNGQVLLDLTQDEGQQVMKASTAFLLTDAMSESMKPNRAFASSSGPRVNSTSTAAHFDGMSLAGKSGTTSNNVDVWFVGFSPYYTAGIWGGCDDYQKLVDKSTGEYNGGTSFHKKIWKNIMQKIHEGKTDPGFNKPANIIQEAVCRKSGLLPKPGICENDPRGDTVYEEYFALGTEPTESCDHHGRAYGQTYMILPEGEEDLPTDDRRFSYVYTIPEETVEEHPESEADGEPADPTEAQLHGPGAEVSDNPKVPASPGAGIGLGNSISGLGPGLQ